MPIEMYHTNFGNFPLIVDDEVMAFIKGLNWNNDRDLVTNSGAFTSDGSNVFAHVPTASIVPLIGVNAAANPLFGPRDTNFRKFFPVYNTVQFVNGSPLVTTDYAVGNSSEKYIRVSWKTNSGNSNRLDMFVSLVNNGTAFAFVNSNYPFGNMSTVTAGATEPNIISYAILSCNSTKTEFWGFQFAAGGNNRNECTGRPLSLNNAQYTAFFASLPPVPPPSEDPYAPGGSSQPGGGGMSGDPPPHDSVDFPVTPTANALNAGFISIWTPSEDQVQTLAAWLWTTDLTKIATWQKLIQNPLDLIFGLSILPIPIHHTDDDTPATEEEIVALNDPMTLGWIDTGIGIDWITDQYVEIDCGSIDMDEYWKAYLDYAPYTKMSIYLPYIGVKELNVNDCMNRTISLIYKIDLASGSCVAIIKCDDSVYYHFGGNCASAIPITATQMQEVIRNAVTTAVAVGATAAAVGSGAAPTVIAASVGASAASAARSVMSGVDYHRSGANGGTTGLMSVQTPYLIMTRPRQAIPENQNTYTGYPSFITEQIGDLEGYTEIEIIHMHELTCTSEEFAEIEELLLKGVII